MTIRGIDYAFSPHPGPNAIRAAGFGFVARYMSSLTVNDTNGKNLLIAELRALRSAGLAVVVVEESTAGRMKSGHAAGVTDAQHGQAVTAALGMGGAVIYFACDFDATEADQVKINDYLDGAASVIGRPRTGIYAGYYPLKRAFDAGKAKYGWQTSAWSGGQWDPRAHIRQSGTVSVGGVTVDLDTAMKADFGQWPRPSAAVADPGFTPAPTGLKDATVIADVRLSWNAVPNQTTYHFQHEHYKDGFGWVLDEDTFVDQAVTLHALPAGKHRWRVAAGPKNYIWSAWQEFTV